MLSLTDILTKRSHFQSHTVPEDDEIDLEDAVTASSTNMEITRRLRNTDKPWSVGARGLIALFLYEAGRGNRTYRIAAAVALSSLPWKHMSYVAPMLFVEHLSTVCAAIGVEPYSESVRGESDDRVQAAAPQSINIQNSRRSAL